MRTESLRSKHVGRERKIPTMHRTCQSETVRSKTESNERLQVGEGWQGWNNLEAAPEANRRGLVAFWSSKTRTGNLDSGRGYQI